MMTLQNASKKIASLLKERQPRSIQGVSEDLHPLPPFVAKVDWTELGDCIKQAERPRQDQISGDKWISLRCDGTGFSKLTKRLINIGVWEAGYSKNFAHIMQSCCKDLAIKFNAKCAYTQSDEITVLIPPACIVRGEQQCHVYNGRVQKLCSLAAATVTARFHGELIRLCLKKSLNPTDISTTTLPTFDCRVGAYATDEEALSLILWRAYDCGINAVSDAVHKSCLPTKKHAIKLATPAKLLWLKEHDLLPLPVHQREGSFFVKRKRLQYYTEQTTGEQVPYLRGRLEQVEGNVLQIYKDGSLFPPDDVLETRKQMILG